MPLEHGYRREFVADGHDAASSRIGLAQGRTSWATPSGLAVVEGERYVKEWRMGFNMIRGSYRRNGSYRLLAYRGRWHVVSEAL